MILATAGCLLTALAMLAGCDGRAKRAETGKIQVVATLFPQYDFAKAVGGEWCEVAMLLPPGVDSHSFDPTYADLKKAADADLFFYTGGALEPWTKNIVKSLEEGNEGSGSPVVVDVAEGIALLSSGEHAASESEHSVDPHVWTDPNNAVLMVDRIERAFISLDTEHETTYRQNAERLKEQLAVLDSDLVRTAQEAEGKTLFFGGKFAFLYFVKAYGFSYETAFDSCSDHAEPSLKRLDQMVKDMQSQQSAVVFYEEMSDPKVAEMLAERTGAEAVLLHSCHNLSKDEFDAGTTYLDLMRQNVMMIRKAVGLE